MSFNKFDDVLDRILAPFVNDLSEDILREIKENQPVDDTTKEKAMMIKATSGKNAWIKDGRSAIDAWSIGNVSKTKKGTEINLVNGAPWIWLMELGLFDQDPDLIGKNPVERTDDGKFSEQAPEGYFIRDALTKVLKDKLD